MPLRTSASFSYPSIHDPKETTVAERYRKRTSGKGERVLHRLNIPVANDGRSVMGVEMIVQLPLTESEWRQFQKVLRRMKPGMVEPDREGGWSGG